MPESCYHHGDLESAVISMATHMLEQEGDKEISLRKIAKAIGVSHQAPYKHFKSKEDVLVAVRENGFQRLTDATQQAAAKHPRSARLQLEAAAFSYVSHAIEYPALYQLMFGQQANPRLPDTHAPHENESNSCDAFDALASLVQQGPAPFSSVTRERTLLFWSLGHGIASLAINGHLEHDDAIKLVKAGCRALTADWFD